ncbi:MAG: hypothetical protein CVV23_03575 [Ignavibacteriae bacterium HGW-Ignavibacteriae-2]|nr:hypothetical protein [Bacteroidota bacterium]PKL89782.1 MAG: hypothetical protein CVV23_03575 [Ignavibacteriae bacterium HGW-Ignavibacteriae-2]
MSNEEKIQWYERAVKFQLDGLHFLVMRSRKNGKGSWVIEDSKTRQILNSNMEWESDLPKKEQNEAFLIRTRYDLETAISVYDQYKMFADSM